MNIRSLEYLLAIDDLKHFGKAADRCNVSQPTLSGQLKKLEEELDVQLVERDNRRVFLTDVGQEIVQRARIILREAHAIEELARNQANPMAGRLRLGLIPTIAPYLLPLVVGPIKQNWPDLRLELHEAPTADLLARLREGIIDVAILALGVPGTESYEALLLFEDPFFLAAATSHPLAERSSIGSDDLQGQPVLLLEEGHCLRGQALSFCATLGARETEGFRGTSLETLRHMVAAGDGLTLIPQLAATPHPSITYIPFTAPAPSRQIGLIYRGNTGRRSCFRAISSLIRKLWTENQTSQCSRGPQGVPS